MILPEQYEEGRGPYSEIANLKAEIARLQDWKRKQMEDIMTLGQQVGKLEMERDRLQAELENERAHNKRLLAQLENWDLIEMNKDNMRLQATLEEFADTQNPSIPLWISMKARKALAKEEK